MKSITESVFDYKQYLWSQFLNLFSVPDWKQVNIFYNQLTPELFLFRYTNLKKIIFGINYGFSFRLQFRNSIFEIISWTCFSYHIWEKIVFGIKFFIFFPYTIINSIYGINYWIYSRYKQYPWNQSLKMFLRNPLLNLFSFADWKEVYLESTPESFPVSKIEQITFGSNFWNIFFVSGIETVSLELICWIFFRYQIMNSMFLINYLNRLRLQVRNNICEINYWLLNY